jgi:toxin ParE1/3/4
MVKWSKRSRSDLKSIFTYIASDSKFYAQKVMHSIIERAESLSTFPKRGRVVPEINDGSVREIFIFSYRMIYEVIDDDVFILTIVHGKRELSLEDVIN